MFQSNLAFYSNNELPIKMKELANNWENFMLENQKLETIRPIVYQSWKRCQNYAVDPLQKQAPVIMEKSKLLELISRSNLYDISQPVIEDLYKQIKGTQHLITLSDSKGRIIHIKGEYKVENQAQAMNFIAGADWSEEIAGTNAIGTSLASGQPIQILSHEHYCEGVHPWICSAAPIRDPLTKKILGIIDLTGPSESAQSHSLSIVQSVSGVIEQLLLKKSYKILDHLQAKYDEIKKKHASANLIVFDETLHVIRGDATCLSLLQINHWNQIWSNLEMNRLKTSLLESSKSEYEWECEISSLQLKVYIQGIRLEQDQVGFIFCLDKKQQMSQSDTALKGVIGQSTVMKKVIRQAQVISNANVPVLLTGESGTGKEVFAYAIHQQSLRRKKPFIAINCGAIPDNLIASELFGYEAGAFTGGNPQGKIGKFEEANNGTIFLDEIGEMPLDLQVHLLRVLQEKEVVRLGSSTPIPINVRIIAATNSHLQSMIDQGLFRLDLYFRLNVVELHLPPLKDRNGDIRRLTEFFVHEFAKKHQKQVPIIDKNVFDFFHNYDWPGNVRELMNVTEYAILFSEDNRISLATLPTSMTDQKINDLLQDQQLSPLEIEEKEKIKQLISETNANLSEVARQCKIARSTLYRKIEKYKLHYLIN